MQKCTSCGVQLTGERQACPLCGKKLDNAPETENFDLYPTIPVQVSYDLIFKISTLVAVFGISVVAILNRLFIPHLRIYVPLTLSLICAWIIVNVGFKKRKNIPKSIFYEAVISVVLCILWDYFTDWRGWSIGYVLPATSAGLTVFYFVMGIADRIRLTAYTAFFMMSEIGILACLILVLCNVFSGIAEYFAVISVAVGLLLFIAQVIFRPRRFASELHRWLHL